ncbi:MAG: response regulator [Spirochaetaceae bacterium]|nr:response regulator [Spirochaetaceae bacterium]
MSFTILIVDDSEFARKVLKKSLHSFFTGKDYALSEAGNGEEALGKIKESVPHFMFLDLTMPVMDGYELLEELKTLDLNIPTVVISADIQEEAEKKVKELGVLGFLNKPLNQDRIADLLKEVNII